MNWLAPTFIALVGSASYVSFLKLAQGYYDPKTVQSFPGVLLFYILLLCW